MLNTSSKSKFSAEETVKKATAFFGPKGYGLKMEDEGDGCISFEGGDGKVNLTIIADKKGTKMDIEATGWEEEVREFIKKLS